MQASRISQFIFVALVVLMLLWVVQVISQGKVDRIDQSELKAYIVSGNVDEVEIHTATNEFRGTYRQGFEPESADGATRFVSDVHSESVKEMIELMDEHLVKYGNVTPTVWDTICLLYTSDAADE